MSMDQPAGPWYNIVMSLPEGVRHEPERSRLAVIVASVLSATGAAVLVGWGDSVPGLFPVIAGAWFLLLLGLGVGHLIAVAWAAAGSSAATRPVRLRVTGTEFAVWSSNGRVVVAVGQIMLTGLWLAVFVRAAADSPAHAAVPGAALGAFALLAAATAAMVWRGAGVALGPAGIRWHGPLSARMVPWEALSPGGPARPPLRGARLQLAVAHPDLVVQRGWAPGRGSRERPALPRHLPVHPWFLADAIRWYVDHPEDRGGIGTRSEHDRLVARFGAGTPDSPDLRPAGTVGPASGG
jgi:hypothetical protein